MDIMKRNLLITALFAALCIQANAAITVEQTTNPEYLINSGYSEVTAEEVLILKNRAAGKPIEPLYEQKNNKFVRFFRNIFGYIDPAQDTDERLHHDIHVSPSWKDL